MKFRLASSDALRLGCPQDVEFDAERIMGREAIMLSKIGWPPDRLAADAHRPVLDGDGKPVFERDERGEFVRDGAGNPVVLFGVDPEALMAVLWLAVRRAGVDIDWKDFDVDLQGVEQLDEDEEPGKATPATTSKRTTSRTRSPSSRRSG